MITNMSAKPPTKPFSQPVSHVSTLRWRTVALMFLLPCHLAPATGDAPHSGPAGHWEGAITLPMEALDVQIDLEPGAGDSWQGTIAIPAQGLRGFRLDPVTVSGANVKMTMPGIPGDPRFTGRLAADAKTIRGEFSQGGQTFAFMLERKPGASSTRQSARPQEPKPPFPYDTEDVVIANETAGVTLAGTLTLPRGAGPHPVALLLTGSGPQDRDEGLMGHRPFFVLADHLTRAGIATLRCDDRGVGKSTGDFAAATNAEFVADALAQVAFLRGRKDIDPTRIGLIGHSEGGITAPRAAVKSPHVSFIVLLAGVGVPMDELLVRQSRDLSLATGASESLVAGGEGPSREIFRILKEEKDPAKAEAAIRKINLEYIASLNDEQRKILSDAKVNSLIEAQMRMILSPWLRELLAYDPRATLRLVKCPVLAINGEKDMQVAASENLAAIRSALTSGGNKSFKTAALPGLNHLFQKCKTGGGSEYSTIEETFNPAALEMISGWIVQTLAR